MNDVDIDKLFDNLFHSTIGFDYLSPFLHKPSVSYPRYDVYKEDANKYRLDVALAGYKPEDIDVLWQPGKITIASSSQSSNTQPKTDTEYSGAGYLRRGIAKRDFTFQLALPDYVEITDAVFDNGLLSVSLARNIPEYLQPKKIEIKTSNLLAQDAK